MILMRLCEFHTPTVVVTTEKDKSQFNGASVRDRHNNICLWHNSLEVLGDEQG